MTRNIWMLGTLAAHPRGKVIAQAVAARPATAWPEQFGIGLAFGQEFQEASEREQLHWLRWSEPPGRTLILLPPYKLSATKLPVPWRIYRPTKIDGSEGDKLPRALAADVRHELTGSLQVPAELGARWKGDGINTAYYRKHPHAGLFVITCLPLWSLIVLDHREALAAWLEKLAALAGEPAAAEDQTAPADGFQPEKDHYAMLLHLCEGVFSSRAEALRALTDSPVLALPETAADERLHELESAGLAAAGRLTDAGRTALFASPYAVYAEAIERSRG